MLPPSSIRFVNLCQRSTLSERLARKTSEIAWSHAPQVTLRDVFQLQDQIVTHNVSKATLEGLFADELALLQPTPGYMRLLTESVLQIWKARRASVREELANSERAAKAIQDKLDRLDEAFLFERSIDIETYDRHAEKLREQLTLARIDRHSGQLQELDVEGILAFAERILPRAADLWVHASLEQRHRFQQLFFPDGLAFDGNWVYWNRRNRTGLQLLAGNQNRK